MHHLSVRRKYHFASNEALAGHRHFLLPPCINWLTISSMTTAINRADYIPEWTIADRMRKAREVRGLTQAELAKEIGVVRSTVARTEQGISTPRKPLISAWALATSVDRHWLETGKTPAEHAGGGDGGGPCGARTHDLRIKSP